MSRQNTTFKVGETGVGKVVYSRRTGTNSMEGKHLIKII